MDKNSKITLIKARQILDSRGNWTVEVDLETPQGLFKDSAPSGASTGKYEAPIVSPEKAVRNINRVIALKLKGKDVADQPGIDSFLDPAKFGANATTAVSMAICRAAAFAQNLPLWKYINQIINFQLPSSGKGRGERKEGISLQSSICNLPKTAFNMINGGAHASNRLDFQEFMIVCNTERAAVVYQDLRKKLGKNVGDEGGFAPAFKYPEEALEFLSQYEVKIIIDVAASQLFDGKIYKTKMGDFTPEGLSNYYSKLIKKYPLIALEDPFAEDDLGSWQKFNPKNVLLIGDDLLATNPERIKTAKEKNLCNGLLLKINQIGTITKSLEATGLAKSFGWKIMVSHRSGETNDDFIADFAVGIGADFIKAGAPARGERVAKYNRLLKIKEEILCQN